jgi:hypothetical protein
VTVRGTNFMSAWFEPGSDFRGYLGIVNLMFCVMLTLMALP